VPPLTRSRGMADKIEHKAVKAQEQLADSAETLVGSAGTVADSAETLAGSADTMVGSTLAQRTAPSAVPGSRATGRCLPRSELTPRGCAPAWRPLRPVSARKSCSRR
jgi:hypothetical protein